MSRNFVFRSVSDFVSYETNVLKCSPTGCNYESPTTPLLDDPMDGGKARILRRRAMIRFRNLNGPLIDH